MKHSKPTIVLGLFLILAGLLVFPQASKAVDGTVMWINHLDFLPGDPSVVTSFNAYTVPPTIEPASGLVITSTTPGVCRRGNEGRRKRSSGATLVSRYRSAALLRTDKFRSYISDITLMQLRTPGAVTPELLDGTDRTVYYSCLR